MYIFLSIFKKSTIKNNYWKYLKLSEDKQILLNLLISCKISCSEMEKSEYNVRALKIVPKMLNVI